jgi:ribonuclease HI
MEIRWCLLHVGIKENKTVDSIVGEKMKEIEEGLIMVELEWCKTRNLVIWQRTAREVNEWNKKLGRGGGNSLVLRSKKRKQLI